MAKEWTEKELQAELIATLNQCEWRRALDGGISAEANLRADPQTIIADVYQHLRERVSVKLVCEPHTYQIAFSSEAADHLQDRGLEICPPIPEAADCVDASTCTDRESLVSELNKLKWSCQNGVFSAETTIAGSRTKFARDVVAYVAEMASLNYDKERGTYRLSLIGETAVSLKAKGLELSERATGTVALELLPVPGRKPRYRVFQNLKKFFG